jgi:hypothetical protein
VKIEHAYDWFVSVTILEVDGTELSTPWRACVTIGDNVRASIELLVESQLLWFRAPGVIFFRAGRPPLSTHAGRQGRGRFPDSRLCAPWEYYKNRPVPPAF